MQLAEVQQVISSQCGAAATLLVRAVPAGQQLAPDTAAVTVLLTCPASPGGGSSQQAATGTQAIAEVADAAADGQEAADHGEHDAPPSSDGDNQG